MSALSVSFFELAKATYYFARQTSFMRGGLEVVIYEIDTSVHYLHKNDGYREIRVYSKNMKFLLELENHLHEWWDSKERKNVRVYWRKDERLPKTVKDDFYMDISIWK